MSVGKPPQSTAPADADARRQRMISGSGLSAANILVFVVYQLASVPIFLARYGTSLYGSWLILYSIPALLSLSDLGVPTVFGAEMTMLRAAGRIDIAAALHRRLRSIARIWLALLIASLICVVWATNPVTALHLHGVSAAAARLTATPLIIWLGINLYWGTYSAAYRAAQQFPRNILLVLVTRIVESAVIIGTVAAGCQIPVVAWVLLGARIIMWAFVARDCARRTPWRSAATARRIPEGLISRRFVTASLASMAFPAGNALQNQGVIVLVGAQAGPAAAVLVNTLRTITNSLYQLNGLLEAGVGPEISERFGASDIAGARRITVNQTAVIIIINVIAALTIIAVGPFFLTIWSTGKLHVSVGVIALFALTSVGDCLWIAINTAATARNRPQLIALGYVIACAASLPLMYWMLPKIGVAAVPIALFSTCIVCTAVAVPVVCGLLEMSATDFASGIVTAMLSIRLRSLTNKVPVSMRRAA